MLVIPLFAISYGKESSQQDSTSKKDPIKLSASSSNNFISTYSDSCIQAARLWLQKNDLSNLIGMFENDQKEKSKINHSINYAPGKFIIVEISSSPLKYSVSYSNTSTSANFVVSWTVDFSTHRVYANPNEYGYDKEGIPF
jgi:hypothetical protein